MRAVALILPFAFTLSLLSPAPASAQKTGVPAASADRQGQARARAKDALKLYQAGETAEAYATFREAEGLFHAPTIVLYIARCQRRLGKLLEARASYESILAEEVPKGAAAAFVSAHVDAGRELTELKSRIPSLRVIITGAPPGAAQVTVDGEPWPDETRDIDPGSHLIAVKRAAGDPITRQVVLDEGRSQSISIDLPASSAPPGGEPAKKPAPPRLVPAAISFGLGGAGLIVGSVFGALALAKASDLKDRCGPPPVCLSYSMTELADQKSAASTRAWVANVAFIAGAAGVAAGVILLATAPRAPEAVKQAVGPGGITLRF